MPKVGGKHFSYSEKGKKAAKAHAKKTGQSIESSIPAKKYKYGGSVDPFSSKNPEGVAAKQVAEMTEEKNTQENAQKFIKQRSEEDTPPETNAMERSKTFQMGGNVLKYKEGGKV